MSASSKKKLRKEQEAAAMTEKQQQQAKETKKLKIYTWSFVVIMVLVVAIVIGATVRIPVLGMLSKNTTAAKVGDRDISNTVLNYFYIDLINEQYEEYNTEYGEYANIYAQMLIGLNFEKPLNSQIYDTETKETWADHFIKASAEEARSVYAIYDEGKKNGHTMTKEEQENMEGAIASIESYAKMLGYSGADSYLRIIYGNTASFKTYKEYYEVSSYSSSYYNAHTDTLKFDADDYRAYEKDKPNDYTSYSYAIYNVYVSDYLTGGTEIKNEDGTSATKYSDAEREAARKLAEADAKALVAGKYESLEKLNEAIKALKVNADDKDSKAGANEIERILYSELSSEEISKWVVKDLQKNDMHYFSNKAKSTNDAGKEVEEVSSYSVLMFLEKDDNTAKLVDVRHILVKIQSSTTDSTTGNVIYTEEQKKAALEKAENILNEWKSGKKTEESFAELAKEKSEDTGSKENGGLYEDIHADYGFVEEFQNWCLDESRKVGDTGIVMTEHGYHIMYFCERSDMTYRDYMIDIDLKNEALTEWEEGLTKDIAITIENPKYLNREFSMTLS